MVDKKELKKKPIEEEIKRLILEVEVLELYAEMLYKKKLSSLNKEELEKVCRSLFLQSLTGVENEKTNKENN